MKLVSPYFIFSLLVYLFIKESYEFKVSHPKTVNLLSPYLIHFVCVFLKLSSEFKVSQLKTLNIFSPYLFIYLFIYLFEESCELSIYLSSYEFTVRIHIILLILFY